MAEPTNPTPANPNGGEQDGKDSGNTPENE